ncbi:Zn(2)-C6 fungal-type domain-containing protein [[Candida] zeylanoides]
MIMKNKTKILGPFGVFLSVNGMKGEESAKSDASSANKTSPNRKSMANNNSRSTEAEFPGSKKSKPNDSFFGGSPLGAIPPQVAPQDQLWLSNELRDDALLTAAALNGDTQFLDFMSTLSTSNSNVFTPVNVNNYSYNTNQSEFLNLVFHRNSNHGQHSSAVNINDSQSSSTVPPNNISMLLNNSTDQHLFERSHQAAAAAVAAVTSVTPTSPPMHTPQDGRSVTSHAHGQNMQAQGQHENMQYSNYSDYYYNNPYKQNESLEIHLDASAKHSYKADDNETNTDLVDGEQGNATTMPTSIMRTVDSLLEPELGFEITIPPQESQADHMGKVPPGLPSTALQVQPLTRYLLNYYVNQVADLMTVIPLTENPWKSIYFPRALMAIGELSALGHTSDAKNALLNALLAVSAFNLQSKFPKNSPPMKFYLNLGIRLRNQASVFVKKLLNSSGGIESCVRNEKYKDVLCAVMSMISVDLVWGTMQDTNYYISWCGKVISLKMVNKKKLSSKARILHRIFSSLKLIQDSTCLDIENIKRDHEMYYDVNGDQFGGEGRQGHNNTAQSSALLAGAGSDKNKIDYILSAAKSEANKHGAKSAAITMPPTTNRKAASPSFLNKKLINIKKNDENFATDALYGLPNSLILLFGSIVRILRTKLYHRKTNSPLPNTYEGEVDAINDTLKSWELDWVLYEGDNKFISPMHEATYHHIMSFYHALNIYFSKLVLDIPGSQLQESVEKTLDHLNAIQLLISRGEAVIIPLFWQGFIAGCEAISQELQMGFKKWGADIAQYLGSYWGARQIMLEVWRRKRMGEGKDDWVSVIQDWEMNLMLN